MLIFCQIDGHFCHIIREVIRIGRQLKLLNRRFIQAAFIIDRAVFSAFVVRVNKSDVFGDCARHRRMLVQVILEQLRIGIGHLRRHLFQDQPLLHSRLICFLYFRPQFFLNETLDVTSDFLRVRASLDELELVLLQGVHPALHISCVAHGIHGKSEIKGKIRRRHLRTKLFFRIFRRSESVADITVKTTGMPCPMPQLMQRSSIIILQFREPLFVNHVNSVFGGTIETPVSLIMNNVRSAACEHILCQFHLFFVSIGLHGRLKRFKLMLNILCLTVGVINLFTIPIKLGLTPAAIGRMEYAHIAMCPSLLAFRQWIPIFVFCYAECATDADAPCAFTRTIKRRRRCGRFFAVCDILLPLNFCFFTRPLRHFLELIESIKPRIAGPFLRHNDRKIKLVLTRIRTASKTADGHPHCRRRRFPIPSFLPGQCPLLHHFDDGIRHFLVHIPLIFRHDLCRLPIIFVVFL